MGPLEGYSMALEKIEKIQRKKNLHEIDFVFSIFQKKFPSIYLYYSFLLFLGPSHFMCILDSIMKEMASHQSKIARICMW